EGIPSNTDPSAVKEAEISDVLQHDSQAPRTTLSELDTLASKAPATGAPPDMASESMQTGTADIAVNPGQEKLEKLEKQTAYLGGKGEDINTVKE
ncbi:MAG: hypothetical protein Q9226_009467, partial [Calogaya cf. arnoldii]